MPGATCHCSFSWRPTGRQGSMLDPAPDKCSQACFRACWTGAGRNLLHSFLESCGTAEPQYQWTMLDPVWETCNKGWQAAVRSGPAGPGTASTCSDSFLEGFRVAGAGSEEGLVPQGHGQQVQQLRVHGRRQLWQRLRDLRARAGLTVQAGGGWLGASAWSVTAAEMHGAL